MENFAPLLQYLISGLTNGAIYALIALGFGIIYNATTIINFAQGEMVMLGAMVAIRDATSEEALMAAVF